MSKGFLTIEFEEFNKIGDLSAQDERDLLDIAWTARESAYAPYSHFYVGAAVLTADGEIIFGNNQENANYKGSCAERVALDTAGAAGLKNKIVKIAVVGGPDDLNLHEMPTESEMPVTPCGQCRQDIKEAEDLSGQLIIIILASRNRILRFIGIECLMPFGFGPSNLHK